MATHRTFIPQNHISVDSYPYKYRISDSSLMAASVLELLCAIILRDLCFLCRLGKKSQRPRRRPLILWKYARETKRQETRRWPWLSNAPKTTKSSTIETCRLVKTRNMPSLTTKITKLREMRAKLRDWNKSAPSTKKWSTCRKGPMKLKLRQGNTWFEAKKRNKRSFELRNRPWKDNSKG